MANRDDIGASKKRRDEDELQRKRDSMDQTMPFAELYERSKDDRATIVGSEVREVIDAYRRCLQRLGAAQPKESVQPQLPPIGDFRNELCAFDESGTELPGSTVLEIKRRLRRERQLLTALAELATLRAERVSLMEVLQHFAGEGILDPDCPLCKLADSLLPQAPVLGQGWNHL